MSFFEFIQDILQNSQLTNYIILVQIPIVLCLVIQSYQAYKLGFKEFRLISIAWLVNLIYLAANIFIRRIGPDSDYKTIIRTAFDLLSMYFFLFAVINSFQEKLLSELKKIPKTLYVVILLGAGIIKLIPGSLHIIPYVHLRFVPAACVDFFVLFLLAVYFKNMGKKVNQKPALFFVTLFYSLLQFISILQVDKHEPNIILLNIDNIGFGVGLLLKLGMLISLSLLLISDIKNSSDKLLHKLKFATKILTIQDRSVSKKNIAEQENYILESFLEECLNLLNERLGYYATYDSKSGTAQIVFASKDYKTQIGEKFSSKEGMTGKAITMRTAILMKNQSDTPEYTKFNNTTVDKDVKSAVAIPVILGDQVLGVYMIESELENYFTDTEFNILKALVSQAVAAITNIRQVQEIELGKSLFESLKNIDKSLVDKSLELKDVLHSILKQSLALVNGEMGNISLKINEKELRLVASTDPKNIDRKVDIHDSISGLALREKATKYFPNLAIADPEYQKLYKQYLGDNLVCELVVPLIVQNEAIGVFNTESNTPNKFTQSDIDKVTGFAGQAAVAIHNYQLFEDVKKHKNRLEALAEIDLLILNSNQSLPDTLEAILQRGLSLIKRDHGEILLLELDQNGEERLIIKKSTEPSAEGKSFSAGSILSRLAIQKRKIVYLPYIDKDVKISDVDMNDDSIYIPTVIERLLYKKSSWKSMKSELVLPLIIKEKVIGIFNIESPEYNDFHQDERNLFKNLALAAAIAIHNAQLFEEINLKKRALENSVDKGTINMSIILGKVINHRIGNSVGTIRTTLRDKLMFGDYGHFSEEVTAEFRKMVACAEKVLGARNEISEKIKQLLVGEPIPIDFKEVKRLIEDHEDFRSRSNIKISIHGFDKLKPVLINLNLFMEGIVLELIRNAIKSMPNGGNMTIVGKHEGNFNIFSFTDTGCGIEEKEKEMIFYQGYSKWSNGTGSGIGLFELRSIIEFFRGHIEVQSKIKQGTSFKFQLPIVGLNNITT